ncbi:hypothetical protein SK128_015012 [Halocaridina rubra]|uniref:SET domain-containing protein n=1 Tax=Halocaridina rubra TaxID=373956 RepID=A0AAN8XH70_HALRR
MAVVLTWLLKESGSYFSCTSDKSFTPSQEDYILVGSTLFVHMMNLPCNAHSITELQINVNSLSNSFSQEIGCGAFGVLSLTNHSCNPSAARFSHGKVVTLRAISFIKKGAEITDSYGEHYALEMPSQRNSVLSKQYCFTCLCEPCKNNWPTYANLTSKFNLKCCKCGLIVDSKGWCISCNVTVLENMISEENIENSFTSSDLGKHIEHIMSKYINAHTQILAGEDSILYKDDLRCMIRFIDKYVVHPCKTYFEAQETLKHYYERLGSRVYRKDL